MGQSLWVESLNWTLGVCEGQTAKTMDGVIYAQQQEIRGPPAVFDELSGLDANQFCFRNG